MQRRINKGATELHNATTNRTTEGRRGLGKGNGAEKRERKWDDMKEGKQKKQKPPPSNSPAPFLSDWLLVL